MKAVWEAIDDLTIVENRIRELFTDLEILRDDTEDEDEGDRIESIMSALENIFNTIELEIVTIESILD
jgi:hypothetical protein